MITSLSLLVTTVGGIDSADIKNKIMNRENIQEDFRKQTGQSTITLNKCDVGTNPEYVIRLEKRILALYIPHVSNSVVCDYCKDTGWDSYPNHDTTPRPFPEYQP